MGWNSIASVTYNYKEHQNQTLNLRKTKSYRKVQPLVNASDRGLINCIHAALFFTKDIPTHITPNNAELACLDLQNTM